MFKSLLGAFVELDETPKSNKDFEGKISVLKTTGETSIVSSNIDSEKFKKYFDGLMDAMNLPGPDHFELVKAYDSLKDDVPNETSRFKIAFNTLKVSGLTKEKAIESAKNYIQGILQDKEKFLKSVDDKNKTEVEARKDKIEELGKKSYETEELIKTKQQELTLMANERRTLQTEIDREQQKINENKTGYLLASEQLIAKITSDISKIQSLS